MIKLHEPCIYMSCSFMFHIHWIKFKNIESFISVRFVYIPCVYLTSPNDTTRMIHFTFLVIHIVYWKSPCLSANHPYFPSNANIALKDGHRVVDVHSSKLNIDPASHRIWKMSFRNRWCSGVFWWIYQRLPVFKMLIFHSYVKLPEGKSLYITINHYTSP